MGACQKACRHLPLLRPLHRAHVHRDRHGWLTVRREKSIMSLGANLLRFAICGPAVVWIARPRTRNSTISLKVGLGVVIAFQRRDKNANTMGARFYARAQLP